MAVVTLEQAPKKVKDLYHKALAAHKVNNHDYAIELFLKALDLEPHFLEARKMLRDSEVQKAVNGKSSGIFGGMGSGGKIKGLLKKDPMKALAEAEELMRKDPLNPKFIDTYVETALEIKMPEAALMTMEAAREHLSENPTFLEKLGGLYLKLDQPTDAVAVYQQLADGNDGDLRIQKLLRDAQAVNTMVKGNWETDGDFTDKLHNADEAKDLETQAKAQLSTADIAQLIEKNLRLHNLQPDNINYVKKLAELHTDGDDPDLQTAVEYYEKANELAKGGDPDIEKSLNSTYLKIYDHNIAVYEELGEAENAAEMRKEKSDFEFNLAADRVTKYPNDREYKFFYGEYLFNRGMYTEAIKQFQEGKRNPKYRLQAQYYLGRCFKANGLSDLAANTLQEAADEIPIMDETKKDIIYELGEIYEQTGDKAKALEYYKLIYAVDIGYKEVERKIQEGYAT